MITGTISSKGQITIPKKIRELLRVQAYDKIVFIPLEDGKVMISSRQNPAAALFGMLKQQEREKPVSLKEMDAAVKKRRAKRNPS
jgi:AbrB family looped-hinge helix DNA binding protein